MLTRELRTSEPDLPAGEEERVGRHHQPGKSDWGGFFSVATEQGDQGVRTEYHLQAVQREDRGDHERPKIQEPHLRSGPKR